MKKQIYLILILSILSFASNCSVESMQELLHVDKKRLAYLKADDKLSEIIKSSQGVEGLFYYDKNTKRLKYIEIYVYGEMGKNIIKFFFDKENNILFNNTMEYYNHHIYEKEKLEVLSRNMNIYPICIKENPKNLFFGIEEKEYNSTSELAQKLIKYYNNLLKVKGVR